MSDHSPLTKKLIADGLRPRPDLRVTTIEHEPDCVTVKRRSVFHTAWRWYDRSGWKWVAFGVVPAVIAAIGWLVGRS